FAGTKKGAVSETAPFTHGRTVASLRAMPKDVTTDRIHGADARYSFHRLLPSVRRRVQGNASSERMTKPTVNTRRLMARPWDPKSVTDQPALAASQEYGSTSPPLIQTSKCRWFAVERPVLPTKPMS